MYWARAIIIQTHRGKERRVLTHLAKSRTFSNNENDAAIKLNVSPENGFLHKYFPLTLDLPKFICLALCTREMKSFALWFILNFIDETENMEISAWKYIERATEWERERKRATGRQTDSQDEREREGEKYVHGPNCKYSHSLSPWTLSVLALQFILHKQIHFIPCLLYKNT